MDFKFNHLCRASIHFMAAVISVLLPAVCPAQAPETEDTTVRFQATYGWQEHPGFVARYSGPNSIIADKEKMYTATATAFAGFRPWKDGEIYLNAEAAQGVPFSSSLIGLGGFTNGEITRAAGTNPVIYRQRLFLRQTWNGGGDTQKIDADLNQLAGTVSRNRFVLTAGNFSVLDVFDSNTYAKDPRTQFMNWSNWTYAAYDYAADARGFAWGVAGEWYQDEWVLRFGRMSGPQQPNGLPVDLALGKHYGDQIEIERAHLLGGKDGKIRVLAWRNRAVTASFNDALKWLNTHPGRYADPAALIKARSVEKIKYGFGVNVEQALSDNAGYFLRAMQADGRTETYAFTEVDGSFSSGLSFKGALWGRADDTIALSVARNTISSDRRRFLEAGGISFFIGDGALRYRPEFIFESYYSLKVNKAIQLTADFQRVANPAYNADRGPIRVYALRMHAEF